MLSLSAVHAFHGRIEALRGVTLEVPAGEIVALIGANGAGKSTLLMTICGRPPAARGRIVFDGIDITSLPTHRIARLGIAQVPEGRRIFARMTVRENLLMGAVAQGGAGPTQNLDRVFALFPRLGERLAQRGGTLSGGEQQMLAIGRALMGAPRLLLLDEPSLGLAPLMVRQIFAAIAAINASDGTTIVLVEQNAHHALRLARHAHLMVGGQVALSGTGADLLANPDIRAAYLDGAGTGAAG